MQACYYKKALTLLMPVIAMLVLSIPEVAYPDNGAKFSSGKRGSFGGFKGNRGSFRGSRNISRYSGLGTSNKRRSSYSALSRPSKSASNQRRSRSTASRSGSGYSSVKQNYSSRPKTTSSAYSVNRAPRQQLATINPSAHRSNDGKKNHAAYKKNYSTNYSVNRAPRQQLATISPNKDIISKKVVRKPVPTTVKKNTAKSTKHKKHHGHHKYNKHHKKYHGHHKHHGHSSSAFYFSLGGHFYPYGYYHPFYPFGYYYPYRYYSGFYGYDYPFYYPYGYTTDDDYYEEPVYSTTQDSVVSKDYMDSPGWDYLAQRNFEDAINVFHKDLQISSSTGIPKVGLALAYAGRGNLNEAIQFMRDAFRFDADSTLYLYFDTEVLELINELIEKYDYQFQNSNNIEDAFMISALYYMKYDYDNSHDAINRAIMIGDRGPSIGNLHRIVDDQLSSRYAGNDN